MRSLYSILIAALVGSFVCSFVCNQTLLAKDTVATDLVANKGAPIFAPDPGDQPPLAPQINPTLLVAAILMSTAVLLFGLSAYAREKISRKQLIIVAAVLMLITWSSVMAAVIFAPASKEQQAWEEAHRKWENKEVIGHEPIVDPQP